MNINLARLKEGLPEQKEYLLTYTTGLFQVIDCAHNCYNSADVDWSSFTSNDVKVALEMAMDYLDYDSIYPEDYDIPPNEGNAIHEYLLNVEIIYQIRNAKPEKMYQDLTFF
ncbi:hypothetical protein JI735_34130 (plasmid) [Paenibacillus sonchi]|uniref:Uncharacterized protein n=1 Tax=Paenibacillus sonchi TaxID=373687 RepID=A0A974SHB6_9BACL|nr:hypothetical protein [Paenibacillus sonchi]QQZ64480.1 hypothetical protein JI735_34130 [Paenibacillus sonchi]